MKIISLVFFSFLIMCSCSKKTELEIQRTIILDSGLVLDDTPLGTFKDGDVLELHIKAKEMLPTFSGVYVKTFTSSWRKQVCERECRRCQLLDVLMECYYQTQTGNCNHQYRDQIDDVEVPYEFSVNPEDINIKLKIAEKEYSLSNVNLVSKDELIARVNVSSEDAIWLIAVPEKSKGRVQVGFLDFAGCAGTGSRGFSSGGPTGSAQVDLISKVEYVATVILEQKMEEQ